jgi:LysM repeat protein
MSFQFRLVFKPIITIFMAPILMAAILGACQPGRATPTAANESVLITPYWTSTPSPTVSPQPLAGSATATAIPAAIPPPPTPTPFTYVIEAGDTMGVIAYRFGVTVADLRAANPEVDPNLMSVGTVLVIPIVERNEAGTPEALASPTPLPIQVSQPNCYPVASGGAWCLALAHNDQDQPLENLIAWIQLVSADGEVLAGQQAIPPLNLLPAGKNLPVLAFFPGIEHSDARPQAKLISALPVPPGDRRYRPVDVQIEQTEINSDGLYATVQGTVMLLALPSPTPVQSSQEEDVPELTPTLTVESAAVDNGNANQIWLAVTAYDVDNVPVGVRKWEVWMDISPGETLPFEVTVFSLGPKISRVEVLVEARP